MDDPRQWLQFGGQDMERAPAGLPIVQAAGTSAAYHGVEGLEDAAKLANQVRAGEVSPMSDESIQRALNAAMVAQMGGFAGVPARAGETVLGSGAVRKAVSKPEYPMAPKTNWYGDANYQQTGGALTKMTPDEFLAKARPMKIDEVARENIDDLKRHILEGGELDPLALYKNGKEDGRHRAIAAKELGIQEVPVLRWEESNGGEVDAALHAVRQHFDEGGFLDSLRGMFSGPDVMSTGNAPTPGDWGNPELASDFFKADKAMRLAQQARARDEDVTGSIPVRAPLTAPHPVAVEERELPPPPVNIPLEAPKTGVPVLGANIVPASFASQPLAYSPEAPAAPAAAAIDKLTARAPQGPDLTDRQRDLIIRTIAAETSGKTPEESQAIAHVILNRIQSGKYGATPEAVLFAPKQFEPWSNRFGANYPMRFTPESRRYGLGQEALDAALGSEDITKGATNFWAPKAQAALGRRPPKWGRTGGVDIGETRFHNLSRAEGGSVEDRALMLVSKQA